MAKKLNVGALLVAQAARTEKVVDLSQALASRASTPGAVRVNPTAVFQDPGMKPQVIDLGFLLDTPNLAAPFIDAFRAWGATASRTTRTENAKCLDRGFISFLRETGKAATSLDEIDEYLVNGFLKWLNRPDALDGQPLELMTRSIRLGTLRTMISTMVPIRAYAAAAGEIMDVVPTNPWPGISRKGTPTERLSRETLEAVLQAVESEIITAAAMLQERQFLIADGKQRLPDPMTATDARGYMDIAVCLAALDASFPNEIPTRDVIKASNYWLGVALERYVSFEKVKAPEDRVS